MIPFATNKIINITCMLLTTIAGLGFLVWDDISVCIQNGIKEKYSIARMISKLSFHSKIVLVMQALLFVLGTLIFMCFESDNIASIGKYNLEDKLLISAFQSVSIRTAGFASVNIGSLRNITKFILALLMLIGGASGSMAGGLKTTTIFIIIAGIFSSVRGKKSIGVFKKSIPQDIFIKAVTIFMITLLILVLSNVFLVANTNIDLLDLVFESISAIATVGLTSGALERMNILCRSILILLMYIGRIGTVTMAMSIFAKRPKETETIIYAKENVMIG